MDKKRVITPSKLAKMESARIYYRTKVKPEKDKIRKKKQEMIDAARETRLDFFIKCEQVMTVDFLATHVIDVDILNKIKECFVERKNENENLFED